MDVRAKDGTDAPRIQMLLLDLYNYFRMDSSTDAIILFEQLCFVLAQMQERRQSAVPENMEEGMSEYLALVDEFSDTELGRRAAPVLPELRGRPELVLRLMKTACEMVESDRNKRIWLGPVLSSFLEEVFQSRNAGIVCTPMETARELISLLHPAKRPVDPLSVLDPACGSGAFLIALAELAEEEGWTNKVGALGLERDEHLRKCAVLLLHFFGVDERFAQVKDGGFPPQVEQDAYDLVFANPPFRSLPLRDQGIVENEDWDLPVRTKDVHHKFVQRALVSLKKGGRCALIVPDSFLKNSLGGAKAVREWMLRTFCCEAVVKLPAYTFYPQAVVNASVLVLRKPGYRGEIDRANRQILFFAVESDGRTNDTQRLPGERNDFDELRQVWRERDSLREEWLSRFEGRRARGTDMAGRWGYPRCWFGFREDIERNDYSLLPGQYRPQGALDGEEVQDPEELLRELHELGRDILKLMDKLAEAEHEYRDMDQSGAW